LKIQGKAMEFDADLAVVTLLLLLLVKSKAKKVKLDICEVPLNTVAFFKVLRNGNTQFYLQTSHICFYSPAAKHHRPLAGTHLPSHGG